MEFEKKIVSLQIKELDYKQLKMEVETLKLQLSNKEKDFHQLSEEKLEIKRQFLDTIQLER